MPKEPRIRRGAHEKSAKPSKKAAEPEGIDGIEVPVAEILESSATETPKSTLKKKEKHRMKRDAFLRNLGSTDALHSKSHNRRMKRKAKEQIAGGLDDIQAAILDLDNDITGTNEEQTNHDGQIPNNQGAKPRSNPHMIGEGKKATLSKSQRKRALEMEQLRHPMILSNPEFSSNPFQTIRTHAKNTLVQHRA